ncbi:sodium/potassium/calcium exchanger Nckx30C isoform X3 [Diorhabda carinulata]|uniref:sodium/potassium/calcium exchanger Nckx30C isoform X2 n=1 Tax=Diorhabda sublineata TaxID=1163346 RepID=UPI0024E0CC42|nr:sodium/potassium/calcium exchanger Nckx30C isoform X2 [Diorhabda sublineata]XP_057669138.1 sodium/potassium/calcium exchanger Nckx30C isoform X3 [Diorhabda carinulata]
MTLRVAFIYSAAISVVLLLAHRPAYAGHEQQEDRHYHLENDVENVTTVSVYTISPVPALHHNETLLQEKDPLFPKDLFTNEQRRNGAIILHIIGVVYMFVALAIVCDEFFVPALDVIIEKLDIQDDVAGATFMAAGGSAPELFTSVIGVFVSFDDVGIGTIVGSAVFNILFVIGMCAIFSKTVLTLTWWPLFRDCFFYSASLITLIVFFRDSHIYWYEALVLFSFYIAYVSFMKWNQPMERLVKKLVYKNKVTRVRSTDQLMPTHQAAAQALHGTVATSSETSVGTQPGGSVTSRTASETPQLQPSISHHQTGAKFRHGLLQLMIHTIDPMHDGKVDEKATQLHAIASLKVLLDATKPQNGATTTSAANHINLATKQETMLAPSSGLTDIPNGVANALTDINLDARRMSSVRARKSLTSQAVVCLQVDGVEEDPPEAMDISWPSGFRKRITYVLLAPIVFPLWLTLPDTRSPRGKKFFPVTFLGSIVWIAAYSYLMVWWANMVGDTVLIPPEVMGLTFLAAGTSIPDLITSVIVARKGFGDMAVSSSVGSNIFDVTVGLPVPWLLYGIIYGKPVEVNSVGMVCSITILFMMLIFVIMSIACFRWKMNKGLGFTMFMLYFVFVAVSLMFEYQYLVCPF